SISIDAADNTYSPFKEQPELLTLKFGNFDDSFMSRDHAGYNETCWNFFGEKRYHSSPAGGEFNYYTSYDQQHVLDYPAGAHGKSYEEEAAKFQISYMIGNDQPNYQSMERIKEASLASGYKFKIVDAKTKKDSSIVEVKNIGVASFYYDAYPTVNGVRSIESLKNLAPGESKEFHISAGGDVFDLTIKSDRLLPDQTIDYFGTTYITNIKKKREPWQWMAYPSVVSRGADINIVSNDAKQNKSIIINIFSAMGNLMYSKGFSESGTLCVNTGNLARGVYLIQLVQFNQARSVKRFIVQ
ncbi:MAG TPA: T9SS type A sorting domain-containing protein, partial [Bacteroidales bacterium]|nr:T9SS type A sorting domain-containing protein [Bacteroidales bacterium]